MLFDLPAPSLAFDVALEDGANIRVRRHGNPQGPRILLSHGNGFAADAYFPFWRLLLDRYDLVVFDFRNHGQNVPAEPPRHTYAQLSRDLERVAQEVGARLGAGKTIGLFHSMSARTAMKHAIEIGWRWDALMLFDPPDVPPPGHPTYAAMEVFERRLTEFAGNRRRQFASVQELTDEYLQSRATRNWVPGAHELMARSVLRKNPEGEGFVLDLRAGERGRHLRRSDDTRSLADGERVRRARQAARRRSGDERRARDGRGQSGARQRGRLRFFHRRRHRASDADRKARGMLAPYDGVSRQARARLTMSFRHAIDERYFEDYVEGEVHSFGSIDVEQDEIVAFAKYYDPQSLHTDPEAAKSGPFHGLIASGWQTCGLMMRLYVEHYLTHVASLASPGLDELRWLKPVRPGDRLSVRVTVLKAAASKSRPDRGAVTSFVEVFNQANELVMSLKVVNIIGRRPQA